MKHYFIGTICLLTVIINCDSGDNIETLYPIKSISFFSDSTFFSYMSSIVYDEYYYLSDYTNNRIVVLANDLKLLNSYSKVGMGPGEFNGISGLYVSDYIYAVNDGGRRINIYNKKLDFQYSFEIGCMLHESFAINNNGLIFIPNNYSRNSINKGAILKLNSNGILISTFGEERGYKNPIENILRSGSNLALYNSNLVSIGITDPFLNVYNYSGELLKNYDLSYINEFQGRLNFIDDYYNGQKYEQVRLIDNICIYNDVLYMSYYSNKSESVTKCNIIGIRIKGSSDPIIFRRFRFVNSNNENVWMSSFVICQNGILLYDEKSGKLLLYDFE